MDLTDEQWYIIQPLIPDLPRRPDGRGRPWKDAARDIMNGVLLWILRTGAPWRHDLPDRYPPSVPDMSYRRFQQWVRSNVFEHVLQTLATDLRERGELNLSECYTYTVRLWSPKRGHNVGKKTKRGKKGTKKVMAIIISIRERDSAGLPAVAPYTLRLLLHHMKSPPLLNRRLSPSVLSLLLMMKKPARLIGGDKAYDDSDPLDVKLAVSSTALN